MRIERGLLVSRDPGVRSAFALAASEEGLTPTLFESARSALHYFCGHSDEVGLAVVDAQSVPGNGVAFLRGVASLGSPLGLAILSRDDFDDRSLLFLSRRGGLPIRLPCESAMLRSSVRYLREHRHFEPGSPFPLAEARCTMAARLRSRMQPVRRDVAALDAARA